MTTTPRFGKPPRLACGEGEQRLNQIGRWSFIQNGFFKAQRDREGMHCSRNVTWPVAHLEGGTGHGPSGSNEEKTIEHSGV